MKIFRIRLFILCITASCLFSGCNRSQVPAEEDVRARVPVTVTGIRSSSITDYMELNAMSVFLNKSVIKAPVTGYVVDVFFTPGDMVSKGQEIFSLRTKEAAALQHDSLSRLYFPGLIHVRAAISGMILSVEHPKGDFVQEGDTWGVMSVPSSLVFLLEVPFEANPFIKINKYCDVVLPGGEKITGKIISRLPSITESSQTQSFIVEPVDHKDLPENLIAKVRIARNVIPDATLLPKACILTDEVMQHFWVMKLVNDSMAFKVPVTTGLTQEDMVQITEPVFTKNDLFLATGNYGLGDTARVVVVKK